MRIKMKGNDKAWSGIKSIWQYEIKKKCKKLWWKHERATVATKFNVSNIGMVNIVETYWKR